MTLAELMTTARTDILDDNVTPYYWSDADLIRLANRAEREVCRIARIFEDGATIGETVATGTITLAGTAGQIDSVTVNGVVVTSGPVAFASDLTTTAANLAANILAYTSTPDYTAASALAVVTVSAAANTYNLPNGYVVVVTCSGGLSATVTNLAGGMALTRLSIVIGQSGYKLDPRVVDILDGDVRLTTLQRELRKYSYRDFQNSSSQWDTLSDNPRGFCLDWQEGYLTLDRLPTAADTAKLRVVRLPLADMAAITDSPEIPLEYHDFLPDMMAFFAYQRTDAQTLNPDGVAKYYRICFDPTNPDSHIERIKRMEIQKRKTANRSSVLQRMGAAFKTGNSTAHYRI